MKYIHSRLDRFSVVVPLFKMVKRHMWQVASTWDNTDTENFHHFRKDSTAIEVLRKSGGYFEQYSAPLSPYPSKRKGR